MQLPRIIKNIDAERLMGFGSMLGIDYDGQVLRVVQLSKKGNPFRKYDQSVKVGSCFTHRFSSQEGQSPYGEEREKEIALLLTRHKIKTRLACALVVGRTSAKTVVATLPRDIQKEEWINENAQKLLNLPISPEAFSFQWEPLEEDRNEDSPAVERVEITFLRKSDIDRELKFWKSTGLLVRSLSGQPARECTNALLLSDPRVHEEKKTLLFCRNSPTESAVITFSFGHREDCEQIILSGREDLSEMFSQYREDGVYTVLVGTGMEQAGSEHGSLLHPFGLPPEYVLASGLAIKGLFPELSPTEFLPEESRDLRDTTMAKKHFERIALVAGVMLFLMLSILTAMSTYFEGKKEALSEILLSRGEKLSELSKLEREVATLEKTFSGTKALAGGRSRFGQILRALSACVPEKGVWLTSLTLETNDTLGVGKKLILLGKSKSSEGVTVFLEMLEHSEAFHRVSLLRTGSFMENDESSNVVPASENRSRSSSTISFEIQAFVP